MRSNSDGRDFLHRALFPVCTRQAQFVFTCRVIDSGKVSKFAVHTDAKKKGGLRTSPREKKLKFLTEKGDSLSKHNRSRLPHTHTGSSGEPTSGPEQLRLSTAFDVSI